MMPYPLIKRVAAEAVGTAMLLATIVGSGVMAETLADGNAAIALLGNTLPTGAILVVLICVFGPISGAHFNPAITAVFALRRDLPARDAVPYIVAQVAGGIAGVWLAHLMFGLDVLQISQKVRFGAGQWLAEALATFGWS